jgi:hypothetical protein
MLEKQIVIKRVTASDANGKMLITVTTSGYLTGALYWWGTPTLADGRRLTVQDLQLALESRQMLESIEANLWTAVDGKLTGLLRSAATYDLSEMLTTVQNALKGPYRKDQWAMDVMVPQLQPKRAYSTSQALLAEYVGEGQATGRGRLDVSTDQDGAPQKPERGMESPEPRPERAAPGSGT